MSPLHWAVEKSYDNISELLIENGANPHIVSKFLKTPYMIAKEKKNDFIINLIEMLPTTPCTPLSSSFDNSVFTKSIPHVKEEQRQESTAPRLPIKRERFHSYDSADAKRLRASPSDAKNFTLQLLKEQMSMMSNVEDNLIQSAISSGRRLMLSEAGKRLLNDSNLNSFLKIPLNTTISSASPVTSSRKSLSPRSATTTTSRRTSDSSDVLEIFRESGLKANNDILNILRSSSASSDLLQEVTITQRSASKQSPVSSPGIQQKTGISLSAINVPKAKAQNVSKSTKTQLPSSISLSSSSLTTTSADASNSDYVEDFARPDVICRKYSELLSNYQQLKRNFEREQQKNDALHRQVTQLHTNFEMYKRQQQLKFDSILTLIQGEHRKNFCNKKDDVDDNDDIEEVL
jgi:acyl transferase domain-containing protein